MKNGMDLGRLAAEPAIRFRPSLLLLAAFLSSPLLARMLSAQQLLREYAFLTSVSAKYVQPDIPPQFATRTVLVQGIADAVLVNGGEAEIVDYKTDRGKTPAALVESYARLGVRCFSMAAGDILPAKEYLMGMSLQ